MQNTQIQRMTYDYDRLLSPPSLHSTLLNEIHLTQPETIDKTSKFYHKIFISFFKWRKERKKLIIIIIINIIIPYKYLAQLTRLVYPHTIVAVGNSGCKLVSSSIESIECIYMH